MKDIFNRYSICRFALYLLCFGLFKIFAFMKISFVWQYILSVMPCLVILYFIHNKERVFLIKKDLKNLNISESKKEEYLNIILAKKGLISK